MNRVFIDTNLLIYLATAVTEKAEKVDSLIAKSKDTLISTQLLNEFASACFTKNLLAFDEIQRYVHEFNQYFNVATVDFKIISESFDIKRKYKYSWFDCMIIATALLNHSTVLYSEDMQHKQKIGKLTIINPFK